MLEAFYEISYAEKPNTFIVACPLYEKTDGANVTYCIVDAYVPFRRMHKDGQSKRKTFFSFHSIHFYGLP